MSWLKGAPLPHLLGNVYNEYFFAIGVNFVTYKNNQIPMKLRILLIFLISTGIVQISEGQKEQKKSEKPVTISGKVLSPENKPVANAVFYVDNIKTSYFTNQDGSYKIKVSPDASRLKVSSSIYGVCDTLINGQTKINFIFRSNEKNQASTSEKETRVDENPSAESKLRKATPDRMNTYTDIYQMIRAEVSGVVVNGRSIVIQQPNSFFGSSDPLFVVDGVIVSTIDNINPVEVKKISVLTGSAAALYGTNGANGVLSITLISGSDTEK